VYTNQPYTTTTTTHLFHSHPPQKKTITLLQSSGQTC
jgi:hypothetical protein